MMRHDTGCREYHALTRRQFLAGAGAAALAAGTLPAWIPQVALADSHSSRDVLVSIYLRGGADGLTLCVPHAEDAYYAARPNLAVPRPDASAAERAIDLDGFFGLPPAMAPLLDAYRSGQMLIVHAAGSTDPSRSHFDAQRFMEVGIPQDPRTVTGWLGRHLATTQPARAGALLRGIGMADGLQRTLYGGPQTLPIPRPESFRLTGPRGTREARSAWLDRVYARTADPLQAAARDTLNTIGLLEQIGFSSYQPAGGAVYPTTPFGTAMRSAAALIKADAGVEALHLDLGGWDTHSAQGSLQGTLATLMGNLAGSLGAFHRDVLAGGAAVTVVVVSEFGRNLDENGSIGTDHGRGTVMLLLGPKVNGGRVMTHWPGLQREQLDRGEDLQVTIDYRDVLAEVVRQRLGNANLEAVFPGHTPQFRGVTLA